MLASRFCVEMMTDVHVFDLGDGFYGIHDNDANMLDCCARRIKIIVRP